MALFAANQKAPVHVLEAPALWITLDIETGDAPIEALSHAIHAWKPPANIKDTSKIDARRAEAAVKIREKAALLDTSPILCVSAKTQNEQLLFNGMDEAAHAVDGWQVLSYGNEHDLLLWLRDWLNARADAATALIGHNLRGFDLPKLRSAYIRHRLKLPMCLALRWGMNEQSQATVDTMALFKAFSMEHRDDKFCSLDTVANAFDIPQPKNVISGAEVPRLHREGRYAEILTYCAIDCATTTRAWQLMSSHANDMQ